MNKARTFGGSKVMTVELIPGVQTSQPSEIVEQPTQETKNVPKGWGVPDHAPAWGFRRQHDSVEISSTGHGLYLRDGEGGTDDDREKPPKRRGVESSELDPTVNSGSTLYGLRDGEGGTDDDREKPPKRRGVETGQLDPLLNRVFQSYNLYA